MNICLTKSGELLSPTLAKVLDWAMIVTESIIPFPSRLISHKHYNTVLNLWKSFSLEPDSAGSKVAGEILSGISPAI